MKQKIFITRVIPSAGLKGLNEQYDVDIWPGQLPPSKEEMIARMSGVHGLLCLLTDPVDEQVIAASKGTLKVISNYAVGFDNIDIKAATCAKIPIGNTPGVLTETTADLAFSLLMSAARRIVEGANYAREGKWKTWGPTLLLGVDIHRATLGILGMGRIGRAMARRAAGFGMNILYCDPNLADENVEGATAVAFDELIKKSDFLSLHVPLNEASRHIIDSVALAKMKKTAVLINTARGGIVDHDALCAALADKTIGYAALDVTEPEPLPANNPLYQLENCLIVPHLGSASVATRDKMACMAVENLLAGLQGNPLPNCVNPEVYG